MNVGFGSKADIPRGLSDGRFTSESGHSPRRDLQDSTLDQPGGPQRLQVARADTLLPREKRAFFLQRVAFHLRPRGAVAPSDADVEAAIAAAQRALTQYGETASR